MVGTTNTIGRNGEAKSTDLAGAPDIEVTLAMIEAGTKALSEFYLRIAGQAQRGLSNGSQILKGSGGGDKWGAPTYPI